jgi:hypothetical protein
VSRVIHPDQPSCTHCGNTHGPWVPSGDCAPSGAQLFLCAPGHGCGQPTYAQRVAARIRPVIDRAEQPLILLADVLDLDVRGVQDRYDGRVAWTIGEIATLAALFGVDVMTLVTK